MTFGEINAEIARLMESCVDTETGELITLDDVDFFERLDALYEEREEKIDSMVGAYKYYTMYADAIKTEKMSLAKRQQIAEHKAESIKRFLSLLLDGEKVDRPQYKISWRKSVSAVCEIPAEDLFPIYRKVEYKPDLTSIKSALKEGATIQGCKLVEKNSISIK